MTLGELDKVAAVRADAAIIGQFLDWLAAQGYVICYLGDRPEVLLPPWTPARKDPEQWLAEYFQIDLGKAEAERQAMLAAWRERTAKASADQ